MSLSRVTHVHELERDIYPIRFTLHFLLVPGIWLLALGTIGTLHNDGITLPNPCNRIRQLSHTVVQLIQESSNWVLLYVKSSSKQNDKNA